MDKVLSEKYKELSKVAKKYSDLDYKMGEIDYGKEWDILDKLCEEQVRKAKSIVSQIVSMSKTAEEKKIANDIKDTVRELGDGDGSVADMLEYECDDASKKLMLNSCRNAVVANALAWCGKAVCNGYMVLRKKGGGTARVYDGDEVEYKGRSFTVKAVGSPQTDKITLDDGGQKVVVSGTDTKLLAVNAEPVAKNAKFNEEIAKKSWSDALSKDSEIESCRKDVVAGLEKLIVVANDAKSLFETAAQEYGLAEDKAVIVSSAKSKSSKAGKMATLAKSVKDKISSAV